MTKKPSEKITGMQPVKTSILGVGLTNAPKDEILEYVDVLVKKTSKTAMIVTPNPEIAVFATEHPDFKVLLNKADLALCDGVGLSLAARILHKPLKERITGVDFMKSLCEKSVEKAYTIGFLGGKPGVAERTAECLRKEYPGLRVHFTGAEWDARRFPKNGVDILFVAYGFPKQEEWIAKHQDILPVKVAMGVGGAFDYISGDVMRAPFVVRAIGLEWLFRLIRQPWRWRRQTALLTFLMLVFRERMRVQ